MAVNTKKYQVLRYVHGTEPHIVISFVVVDFCRAPATSKSRRRLNFFLVVDFVSRDPKKHIVSTIHLDIVCWCPAATDFQE